jgi:hypothetical protein
MTGNAFVLPYGWQSGKKVFKHQVRRLLPDIGMTKENNQEV